MSKKERIIISFEEYSDVSENLKYKNLLKKILFQKNYF